MTTQQAQMSPDPIFWNNLAERYAAKPVDDPDAFDRKIAITRSNMSADSVVLDIGCGTGSLALRLADAGGEIHGLDLSDEMIRIARDKASAADVGNVRFHVGPFDESFAALPPESVDVLCAYSILHLLPERRAALQQMHRLLKPGGTLVASTVVLGESWVPYRPMLFVMRCLGKAPWVDIVNKAELAGELEQAGFVELERPDVGAQDIVDFLVARKPG